jgi:putative SOS response-associated peptidase YedK
MMGCTSRHLGIDTTNWPIRYAADIVPTTTISIIRDAGHMRRVDDAIWWLLLEPTETGWKPNTRYATFNTRYDKLNSPKAAGYIPFRESRCIIPASGFVEGLEGTKSYHLLEGADRAIAFGGLYKSWIHVRSGEVALSASIITLPPHPKFKGIHEKAFPMMLDVNDKTKTDMWLSPEQKNVEVFDELLMPNLVTQLRATPIDRPSKRNPTGESFAIAADS